MFAFSVCVEASSPLPPVFLTLLVNPWVLLPKELTAAAAAPLPAKARPTLKVPQHSSHTYVCTPSNLLSVRNQRSFHKFAPSAPDVQVFNHSEARN